MFVVMTGGMAGIAGTVFVLYATILVRAIPGCRGPHRRLLRARRAGRDPHQPDHGARPEPRGTPAASSTTSSRPPARTMDAIVKGTGAGLELLLNIVAMLIVFVALVYLANAILGPLAGFFRRAADAAARARLDHGAGVLADGHSVVAGGDRRRPDGHQDHPQRTRRLSAARGACRAGALDPRSRLIMLYAMCGFANFGSLGIMIAGLSTMCPQKRDEVVSLGLKSIVSGTLTTCLLGAIVGVLT